MNNLKTAFVFAFGALFGLIVMGVMMVGLRDADMNTSENARMIEVSTFMDEDYHFHVWVDTETNVQYLQIGSGSGLTVMLNADGTPILYEEE